MTPGREEQVFSTGEWNKRGVQKRVHKGDNHFECRHPHVKKARWGEKHEYTEQLAFRTIKEETNACSKVLEKMKQARESLLGAEKKDGARNDAS